MASRIYQHKLANAFVICAPARCGSEPDTPVHVVKLCPAIAFGRHNHNITSVRDLLKRTHDPKKTFKSLGLIEEPAPAEGGVPNHMKVFGKYPYGLNGGVTSLGLEIVKTHP